MVVVGRLWCRPVALSSCVCWLSNDDVDDVMSRPSRYHNAADCTLTLARSCVQHCPGGNN